MLVDSHCHLDFPDFVTERAAIIARARSAGVATMLTIGTRLDEFPGVRAIAEAHDEVWCSVGAHPHEAKDHAELVPEELIALTAHAKVVGIGETGLDFHYDLSPRDVQEQVFRTHIAAARATGLPLVIHAREADREVAQDLAVRRCGTGWNGNFGVFEGLGIKAAQLADSLADPPVPVWVHGYVMRLRADVGI